MQLSINTPKLHSSYVTNAISQKKTGNRAVNCAHASMPEARNYPLNPAFYITPFTGTNVYMLDGGQHADDLYYFAKAINKDLDIEIMPLELNAKDNRIKQIKSLK